MSEYAIIFQVLGALAALFFIFLTYMSTKTWRWLHVTATFFVFAATIAFCVYAAMTLKTRAAWIKLHDSLEKQLATTEEELQKVTRGDPKDIEDKTPSVLSLREELTRMAIDRGRVWRNCQPSIDPRNTIVVRTSPLEDPAAPAPAGAPKKKNNIQAKTILHVFRETRKSEESPLLPYSYLGEFRVTAATDETVTLEPTMPDLTANVRAPGTWSLYEICPVDGHEWFAEEKPEDRTVPLTDASQLERVQLDPRTVQSYVRDGQEIEGTSNTDPPENVWYEVKFEKEYEVPVDAPIVSSLDAEPFNTEGQAVLARLRRGRGNPEESGKVTFGPGENQISTAVLDQQTAQSLIDQGIAKLEKKIYRRKLTDYERLFHSINERIAEINGRVRQLGVDKAAMLAATQKAEQQRALVEELKTKITDDLARTKHDSQELEKYEVSLKTRLANVQNELSQLYRANKALGRELAQLSAQLTEEINRRTREATASAQ